MIRIRTFLLSLLIIVLILTTLFLGMLTLVAMDMRSEKETLAPVSTLYKSLHDWDATIGAENAK